MTAARVHLGRVRRWPAQGHALDHLEQLIRQAVPVPVRSSGSTQPGCPLGEIGRDPPLGGPQRHARRGRRLYQRDPLMHMRSQHGHPPIEGVAHRPQITSPSSPSPSALRRSSQPLRPSPTPRHAEPQEPGRPCLSACRDAADPSNNSAEPRHINPRLTRRRTAAGCGPSSKTPRPITSWPRPSGRPRSWAC